MDRKRYLEKAFILGRCYGMTLPSWKIFMEKYQREEPMTKDEMTQKWMVAKADTVVDGVMFDHKTKWKALGGGGKFITPDAFVEGVRIGRFKSGSTMITELSRGINDMITHINVKEAEHRAQLSWDQNICGEELRKEPFNPCVETPLNPCNEQTLSELMECAIMVRKQKTLWEKFINLFKGDKPMDKPEKTDLEKRVDFLNDSMMNLRMELEQSKKLVKKLEGRVFTSTDSGSVFMHNMSIDQEISRLNNGQGHNGGRITNLAEEVTRLRKFFRLKECTVDGDVILVDKNLKVKQWVKNEGHT